MVSHACMEDEMDCSREQSGEMSHVGTAWCADFGYATSGWSLFHT
jgi:hypothetical protein